VSMIRRKCGNAFPDINSMVESTMEFIYGKHIRHCNQLLTIPIKANARERQENNVMIALLSWLALVWLHSENRGRSFNSFVSLA
jgi:hypothetical protein